MDQGSHDFWREKIKVFSMFFPGFCAHFQGLWMWTFKSFVVNIYGSLNMYANKYSDFF